MTLSDADLDRLMDDYRETVIIPGLLENVRRAYVVGDLIGQRRIHRANRTHAHAMNPKAKVTIEKPPFTLKFGEVAKEALAYLETYQNDLMRGGTWIEGTFVRWLESHSAEIREKVATTISDGIRDGVGRDELVKRLGETLDGERWKLVRIAQTENSRIMRAGMISRYDAAGVQQVRRLLGANPCPICAADKDGVYDIDKVPEDHVGGYCDWQPLVSKPPKPGALMPPKEIDELLAEEA